MKKLLGLATGLIVGLGLFSSAEAINFDHYYSKKREVSFEKIDPSLVPAPSFALPSIKAKEDIKTVSDTTQVMITKKQQNNGNLCGLYASSRNNWRPNILLSHCPGDYSVRGIWFCPEGYIMMPTGHADTWRHTGENHYLIWSCVKNDGRYKDPSPDGRRLLVNYHGWKIYYGPKNYYAYTPSANSQIHEVKQELSSEISTLQTQIASLQNTINQLKKETSSVSGKVKLVAKIYVSSPGHYAIVAFTPANGYRATTKAIPGRRHWWARYSVLYDKTGNIIAFSGLTDGNIPSELQRLGLPRRINTRFYSFDSLVIPCPPKFTKVSLTYYAYKTKYSYLTDDSPVYRYSVHTCVRDDSIIQPTESKPYLFKKTDSSNFVGYVYH